MPQLEAEQGKPVELARQTTPTWTAPHFVWAVQDELARKKSAARTRRPATQLEEGGLRVTTTLDAELQKIAEKWVKRRSGRAPPRATRQRFAKALGFDEYPPWMTQPREQGRPQRGARRDRLPDRRDHRLRRLGELLRGVEQPEVPAPVRRRDPGLPPAGLGVQAVQLRRRHRRPDASPPATCSWTSGPTSAAATRPTDADNLERGPVRVRDALQFSLNIPSVKAMALNSAGARVRPGQGLRDDLPERDHRRRPRAGARRRRDPARSTS